MRHCQRDGGPVRITYPASLAERLDALAIEEDGFPAFEDLARAAPWRGETLSAIGFEAFANPDASELLFAQADASPGEASPEVWDEGDDGYDFGEDGTLTVGAPLDPEPRLLPPQVHVQALLRDFRRRQRHANLLVAGSIATAVLLTLGGLVLVANLAAPDRPTATTALTCAPPRLPGKDRLPATQAPAFSARRYRPIAPPKANRYACRRWPG